MRLKRSGQFVQYNDRPVRAEAIRRLSDTDIAIVEWTSIDRDMFDQINERLKYIVVALTGYEFVDVQAAKDRGILVSNIPGYSRQAVAEHVFALLLALNRRICQADEAARAGKRYYFEQFLSMELSGKTLGILGLGNIGSWVAEIALGFGMKVVAHSRKPKGMSNVKDVSLEELLQISDVLVVCVDHNPTTAGLLSRDHLSLMKPTTFLVSIAHSGICDENVLAEMVQRGRLAGVALDVPQEHSPLEEIIHRSILTPSTAWYTQDSRDRLVNITIDTIENFIAGTPRNLVN